MNKTEEKAGKVLDFYKKHKRMPSYSEVGKICGYNSKSGAHYFINKLIHEGYLAKDGKGKILPKNLRDSRDVRVLGLVEAGFPMSSSDEILDTMNIDDYLIDNKEASYLLTVKGESMVEAGIMPGDLIVVERGKEARVGDIVVCEVDGAYTLKYLRKDKNGYFLEPANKKFEPIYPKEGMQVHAVLKAVIRKYGK